MLWLALLLCCIISVAVGRPGRANECLHQIPSLHDSPQLCGSELNVVEHDYCIVGAGPSGLQLARFLQLANRDYIVLERNSTAGAFFQRFPRHRRLISINKPFTGTPDNHENNLRHDWHSLLSTPMPSVVHGQRVRAAEFTFTGGNYSDEYFPHADTLVSYMQDYAHHFALQIEYQHEVVAIYRLNPSQKGKDKRSTEAIPFRLEVSLNQGQSHSLFICKYVVMASGYHVPRVHLLHDDAQRFMEGYESVSTDSKDFRGQNVLIVGAGNAALEIANSISTQTAHVHLMHRSRLRFSWESHYVGDIRAVNARFLDQYQLKSLDGFLNSDLAPMTIFPDPQLRNPYSNKTQFRVSFVDRSDDAEAPNSAFREGYDRVIRATGFWFDSTVWPCAEFSPAHTPAVGDPERTHFLKLKVECERSFGDSPLVDKKQKFPVLTSQFESINVPHLYFAGALSHGRDHRQSSGGFVHGFRYTVRSLFHIMQERHHGIAWPSVQLDLPGVMQHMTRRMNEASGLYQMFGSCADVVVLDHDGTLQYFEDFQMDRLLRLPQVVAAQAAGRALPRIVTMTYEYHPDFKGSKVFDLHRAVGNPVDAHLSNFLHPIIRLWLPYDDAVQNQYWATSKLSAQAKVPELQSEPMTRFPFTFAGLCKAAEHHVIEDFLLKFDSSAVHAQPLRWFLHECLAAHVQSAASHRESASREKLKEDL